MTAKTAAITIEKRDSAALRSASVAARAEELFQEQSVLIARRTDRTFAVLMVLQWIAAIIIACALSLQTWKGARGFLHPHVWAAIVVGGLLSSMPILLALLRPGALFTRNVIAVTQMLWSALLIAITNGRIETHFHVFGSLAFLAFYRDWRVLIPATIVVAADHMIRAFVAPQSVFGVADATIWRPLEHAGWVIFEDIFLIIACLRSAREIRLVAERQAELEESMRLLGDAGQQLNMVNESLERRVAERTNEIALQVKKIAAISEAAMDCIISMDSQGRVTEFNPAAERTFGYVRQDVIGRDLAELILPAAFRSKNGNGVEDLLKAGGADGRTVGKRFELTAMRADHSLFPLEAAIVRVKAQGLTSFAAFLRDITERKRFEQQATQQRAFLGQVIDLNPTAIFARDGNGKYVLVNRSMAELYGTTTDKLVGHSDGEHNRNADQVRVFRGRDRQVLETGEDLIVPEETIRRPDGSERVMRTVQRRLHSPDGKALVLGVATDITDIKRLEQMERERTHLKDAVAGMQQVIGVVGHELRTPLAGLRVMSELLLSMDPGDASTIEQSQTMLKSLNGEVVRMSDMVNNMLEAARLNSGAAQWRWTSFELAAVCSEAVEAVRPLVARQVSIESRVEPAELTMQGDRDAVRRVILNLASNAQKYTSEGSIKVTCRGETVDGYRWIRIDVADTGEGIPPEIADKLGQAFALNSGVVGSSHVKGSGLGLAICKGIVAAHAGSVSIESARGGGTTATVRLRADLSSAAPVNSNDPGSNGGGKRGLVIQHKVAA